MPSVQIFIWFLVISSLNIQVTNICLLSVSPAYVVSSVNPTDCKIWSKWINLKLFRWSFLKISQHEISRFFTRFCCEYRGMFHNKISCNREIRSCEFFRITATAKFKSCEILNFYRPKFFNFSEPLGKKTCARKIFGV